MTEWLVCVLVFGYDRFVFFMLFGALGVGFYGFWERTIKYLYEFVRRYRFA